jgi:hypothetical protein
VEGCAFQEGGQLGRRPRVLRSAWWRAGPPARGLFAANPSERPGPGLRQSAVALRGCDAGRRVGSTDQALHSIGVNDSGAKRQGGRM